MEIWCHYLWMKTEQKLVNYQRMDHHLPESKAVTHVVKSLFIVMF